MTLSITEIKKKVKFHSILVAPEQIDFTDPDIAKRYHAIISTPEDKVGGVLQWTHADKQRVIATKETGRLRNEAVKKELDIIEGDRLLQLLQEANQRAAEQQALEQASTSSGVPNV